MNDIKSFFYFWYIIFVYVDCPCCKEIYILEYDCPLCGGEELVSRKERKRYLKNETDNHRH